MPNLTQVRYFWIAIALISLAINILVLTSPLYMLQVFDRVVSGRSVETLLYLSLITLFALSVMGGLDACRSIALTRLGQWMDDKLGPGLLAASVELSGRPGGQVGSQPISDLSTVRQFLASPGVGALFDAPWIPFFILLNWILHPLLGLVSLLSAVLLAFLAVFGELATRRTMAQAAATSARSNALLETTLANADVARSMDLMSGLVDRWGSLKAKYSAEHGLAAERISTLTAISKAIRLIVQSAVLGAGAYLVLQRDISPGEMIAASILLSRALAPVEVAIASWRQFVAARASWRRLVELGRYQARQPEGLALPAPKGVLDVEKVSMQFQPGIRPVLQNITFRIEPGEMLGIVGPSASGKSTLGRIVAGAWTPGSGSVRLDGAELGQWNRKSLGDHIGYLPQVVDLFPGTVQDNIARFQEAPLDAVIKAARKAGAHEFVLSLDQGYETDVGSRGERLSGGQRQRIALARALFGAPSLLVLDEPDANLDQAGYDALVASIASLREDGTGIVLIAHRRQILLHCNRLLVLHEGQIIDTGPTHEVTKRLGDQDRARLKTVSGDAKGKR